MENNKNQEAGTRSDIHSEHIKDEFYKWFESRGLLAELRAYMRQLMVKALEENNKNGKKKWQKKASTSPKLQAINLLVVDYLFHEDYFYTVSVFASEAHILDSLPQYSRYVSESVKDRRWDPGSLPRFSRQETEDILDTLHLPPTPLQLRQAADSYVTGHESLLACIVRTMVPVCSQSSRSVSVEEEVVMLDHSLCSAEVEGSCYQMWSQEMQQLLLMAGLKLVHIRRMQQKWAQTIENEREQARREAEERFEAKEAEWQRAVEERLQGERTELCERRSRVEVQEQSLATLAMQLTAVHEDITQRLSQLQLQSEELDERAEEQENERLWLQKKMTELRTREGNLHCVLPNQHENTPKEPIQSVNEVAVSNIDEQLNQATKEAFVQADAEEQPGVTISTQTLHPVVAACTQTLALTEVASTQTVDYEPQSFSDQPDPELVAQLEQARGKISELQEENLELRAHILQQRHRIDELTNRAANLTTQLEESQVAVAVLRGRESAVVAPTPPPPPPVPVVPTFGFYTPQRQGGGEESLFVPRSQQTTPRPDNRRRPLRFAFSQNPSPTSEESSPTDDVIRNARARIQQLEHESVSIQRNFQDFQTRLLTTDSLMFPPLRASRTSDPVMRVRRSEIASSFPRTRLPYTPLSFNNYSSLIQNRQQYEEHDDSSSEFYDTGRIENLTNSRRLYNQKNIRHFERWKQFKKKFQKRDSTDYNRRNFRAPNSNTSSEDDDIDVRNMRRRPDTSHVFRSFNSQFISTQIQQAVDTKNEKTKNQELKISNIDKPNEDFNSNIVTEVQSTSTKAAGTSVLPARLDNCSVKKVPSSKEELTVVSPKKSDSKIELDLERSAKLIESVKVLLEVQSIQESVDTTLSNGSLAVESLPRDSVNSSQIDIGKTDSSFCTVQHVNPGNLTEVENVTRNNFNKIEENTAASMSYNNTVKQTNSVCLESVTINQNQQSDNKNNSYLQESNPEKSSTPLPGLYVESEDFVTNFAATSSDVAELESGDRATTSLTSGSDILRELNPSKTDSSSSVMSAGFAEDSRHSSDFWD